MRDAKTRLLFLSSDQLESAYDWAERQKASVDRASPIGGIGQAATEIHAALDVILAELYWALCVVHHREATLPMPRRSSELVAFQPSNPAAEGPFMPG